MTPGEQIREMRKVNHLSREEFAAVVGAHPRTVERWERGENIPSAARLSFFPVLFGAEPNKAGANAGTERDRPETAMERLRGLRERNCLSREKFARAIGVCPRTVWLWERGSSLPSAAKAALLAERFGVTTEWIFGCDKKKSGRPGTSGSRLKKLRESAGLSATAFGRLTGAGMRAVLHWENDYCVPGPAELAAITEHFGVTPEWILKGTEDSAAELMGVSAVRRKG